jgi:sugar diacid utilization regulator
MLALSRAIHDGDGLAGLVAVLRRVTGGPAAFVDMRGSLLASAPARAQWPLDDVVGWDVGATTLGDPACSVHPIAMAGDVEALLLVHEGEAHGEVCRMAAELAGLDLARLQANVAGRRELASQVLEDVFRGVLRGAEARDRLASVGVGIGADRPYAVIVGRCDQPEARLRMRPWNLHSLLSGSGDPFVRATIDAEVVLVVPDSDGVRSVAAVLLRHLRTLDAQASVGVGPPALDPLSLTISYHQARDAAGGSDVANARPLNLGYLLLGLSDRLPLNALSAKALEPLVCHDREVGSHLVATLVAYLASDCSVTDTAARLFVHRNTLRYRLGIIAQLTGWSADTFEGRLHFWIATRSLGFGDDGGETERA